MQTKVENIDHTRVLFLDGLRGLAITLVVLFHCFVRWSSLVPFGTKYYNIFFGFGFLGVELFFMISGFVILMSLEKARGLKHFAYSRWRRLFPAMLIATVLIYFTGGIFFERPAGIPEPVQVLPGLTFIDPAIIKAVTGHVVKPLELGFWSIFVEVKFYAVISILFFWLGREKALAVFSGLFLFYCAVVMLKLNAVEKVLDLMSLEYFGWFASGCFAYLYYRSFNRKYLIFSATIGLIQIFIAYNNHLPSLIFATALFSLFIAPISCPRTRRFFEISILLLLGFVSYPLYLIHENLVISLIIKLHNFSNRIPDLALPLMSLAIVFLLAYAIAAILEKRMGKFIDRYLSSYFK